MILLFSLTTFSLALYLFEKSQPHIRYSVSVNSGQTNCLGTIARSLTQQKLSVSFELDGMISLYP